MATVYPRGEDKGKRKRCYYIGYKDEFGNQRTKKGFTDRKATQELGDKLEREAKLRREGLVDPAAEKIRDQRLAPVEGHLEAYEKDLTGKKNTLKHVKLTMSRVRVVVDGCEFQSLGDIKEDAVQDFLYDLQVEDDLGNRTYNHYVQAFDAFCNWCVKKHRMAINPVPGLVRLNTEVDVRHKRRALSPKEFEQLVISARTSGEDIQCFSGEDRARIYILSNLTGFRRKEIASLTRRSFDLKSAQQTVTVEAESSKHRKKDVMPLHPELASRIPLWFAQLGLDDPLFPKLKNRRTWLMVKKDLERIGIEYETPEGIADFHAAGRHSYITGLMTNGATLPEAKELARHSDIKQTMKYTHIGMKERAKALANLPFQECHRSNPETTGGHPESSAGTATGGKQGPKETTNPGNCQGYVILCLPETPVDAPEEKWRRREAVRQVKICRRSSYRLSCCGKLIFCIFPQSDQRSDTKSDISDSSGFSGGNIH
jgi:site-specific recombinase XerD